VGAGVYSAGLLLLVLRRARNAVEESGDFRPCRKAQAGAD
jgi:hypothetical protein